MFELELFFELLSLVERLGVIELVDLELVGVLLIPRICVIVEYSERF